MIRRQFLGGAALTAASYQRVLGANDRIRVGIIGCGNQGKNVFRDMLDQPDVQGVAVCDVYQPYIDRGLGMAPGARPFGDYRKMLEMKDLDAVIVATPDHWHALQTIACCQAGKDVYVEKPLSLTVREGRVMVEAARKYSRVVQTGSQQRSGSHYAQAVEMIRAGRIGKVHHIAAGHIRNAMPGFQPPGMEPATPPTELDYEMWLGPAPAVPYHPFRVLYHFRWFWDYSGGQMTNWGAHELDIARWALGADAPAAVSGAGGRFAVNDGGETPDVQEVLYEFPDTVVTWSVRECNAMGRGGLEFHGTEGRENSQPSLWIGLGLFI
jgi:predicted dehydrogenase